MKINPHLLCSASLWIALCGAGLATGQAAAAPFAPEPAKAEQAGASEDELYDAGTRAMNEGRWSDAEAAFGHAANLRGGRAEGSLYWKAYVENKLGRASDALRTCAQLRNSYPQSRWLKECGALEIELRKGGAVSPATEQDDDLKLLALNALMQQDQARALPVLKAILSGNQSEKVKERALFVLTQSSSKEAQDLLGQIALNATYPGLQLKAIHMMAALQGKAAGPTLANIYRTSNDPKVKKTVLQSYIASGDRERVLEAARTESDPQLLKTAFQSLGAMGAASDLLDLYKSSKSTEAKASILNTFVMCGDKGSKALLEIAASEQEPELRQRAIRQVGVAGGASAVPALVGIYQKSADPGSKNSAIEALFVAGAAHDLVSLARTEKDPALRKRIVEKLSVMGGKEVTDYMLEILKN
jgi:HEAT repeat protein